MKRSIAMPSHRNLNASAGAIASAVHFSLDPKNSKTELFISDNSCDVLKDEHPYIKAVPECTMMENFLNAFNGTTGEFVLLMQDDDRIFGLFDSGSADLPTDIIGIQPAITPFAPGKGLAAMYCISLLQESAQERVIAYQESCKGSNLGLFTFWRRDVLKSIMHLWCEAHPMKGAYNDWAVVFALVSSGKVICDPGTLFYKDISNWTVDPVAETKRLYAACGHENMAPYNQMLNAIDGFIMTSRRDSPVAPEERLKAALACLYPFTFDGVMEVLERHGLADKYREFYLYATGKVWGEI